MSGRRNLTIALCAVVIVALVIAVIFVRPTSSQSAPVAQTSSGSSVSSPPTSASTPASVSKSESPSQSESASASAVVNGSLQGPKLGGVLEKLASPKLSKKTPEQQNKSLGLIPSGPGSVQRGPGGSVRVQVATTDTGADSQLRLQQAGASIVAVSPAFNSITVDVAPADLARLSNIDGVTGLSPVLTPKLTSLPSQLASSDPTPTVQASKSAVSGTQASATQQAKISTASVCPSPLLPTADTQLQAALARSQYNVDGSGVKIGIISDSYGQVTSAPVSNDVSSGALPGTGNPCGYTTPVTVMSDLGPNDDGTDEGRGMAQLVHSVAPGAQLYFATGFISEAAMAQSILDFKAQGVGIIVDDVSYLDEPYFQSGIISNAVSTVTSQGVSYFSSAGNSNISISGKPVGSWSATAYRPTTCPGSVLGSSDTSTCMDFDPSGGTDNTAGYTAANHQPMTLLLQWAQPEYGETDQFDIYVLNHITGSVIDHSSSMYYPIPLTAVEVNPSAGTQVDIVIKHSWHDTTVPESNPPLKYMFSTNGVSPISVAEYNQTNGTDVVGPTTYGHNASPDTIGVAAMSWQASTPETYSSRGPATYYYNPVNGSIPATALSTPLVINNPAITSTDGSCTTFFGGSYGGSTIGTQPSGATCPNVFFGTSAAAPNAAAVAALMEQLNTSLTPSQVRSTLSSTASAVFGYGTDSVGGGVINAVAALAAVAPANVPTSGPTTEPNTPTSTPTPTPTPTPSQTVAPAPVVVSPVVTVLSVHKKKVTVKLTASAVNGSQVQRYQYRIAVKSKVNKQKWISVSGSVKKLVLKGLKKGKYVLQVRALNAAGTGPVKSLKIKV